MLNDICVSGTMGCNDKFSVYSAKDFFVAPKKLLDE